MRFHLVSDNEDTLVGMRLAGVDGVLVKEPDSAQKAIIEAMNNIQIEIIRAQPLQAAVNFPVNGFFGQTARIEINLGGDHDPIAAYVLLQRLSQVFLAGSGGITVGCIKKVDSKIEGMLYHAFRGRLIQRPVVHGSGFTKAHAAYADLRDLYLCLSQFRVFHRETPFLFVFLGGFLYFTILSPEIQPVRHGKQPRFPLAEKSRRMIK